ncbi:MAG: putative molybdenum carrier protein [Desulfobacterales bacterium]|nr:putative molybdenum carrier protein [Desulfobacterales bacterium]
MNKKHIAIKQIVSGGQTGADMAALDFAIQYKIPHGGWVPKGRKNENGIIPKKYKMKEIDKENYVQRTAQNVIDSDGTVIISHGELIGGSLRTLEFAIKYNKPCLHIDLNSLDIPSSSEKLLFWINENKIEVLNVAGSRASKDSKIYEMTKKILENMFKS